MGLKRHPNHDITLLTLRRFDFLRIRSSIKTKNMTREYGSLPNSYLDQILIAVVIYHHAET